MMKNILLLLITFVSIELVAQASEGKITYNRKVNWISIMSKLPYLGQEEIDRMTLTWGKQEDNKGMNYELFFKNNKSLYTYKDEPSEYGYSWKKGDFILIRDYKDKTMKDLKEEIGTTFLIEEDIPRTKWKILNEIKEIEGYLCMKAETTNDIKDQIIHAWFTDAIPVYGGPEGFSGLPGLILELDINEGDVIVTATDIDLTTPIEKLPIPKKMKGKKSTSEELNARITKFIAQSIEGQKNPYWRIRY